VIGNDRLGPQTASQAELALGWRPTPGVVLDLSGYVAKVEDLVVLQRRGLNLAAINGASLDVVGAEADLSVRRGPVVLRSGISLVRATRAANPRSPEPLLAEARPAQQFPRISGAFGASLHGANWGLPLALHADGRWAGPRPSSDSNALISEAPYEVSGHLLADLAVTTDGWRSFGGREVVLRAEVQDVFDESPADPGVGGVDLPSLGRRLSLTLEQRF
jgi:iron complex outermembrane receptor protein